MAKKQRLRVRLMDAEQRIRNNLGNIEENLKRQFESRVDAIHQTQAKLDKSIEEYKTLNTNIINELVNKRLEEFTKK